jgi:hypothetical protein
MKLSKNRQVVDSGQTPQDSFILNKMIFPPYLRLPKRGPLGRSGEKEKGGCFELTKLKTTVIKVPGVWLLGLEMHFRNMMLLP